MTSGRLNIAFRVDASLDIGTGHLVRCVTLADALAQVGATCDFLCRNLSKKLELLIIEAGHRVHMLPKLEVTENDGSTEYSNWLGTTQEKDAKDCLLILAELNPEWLVIDHYALSATWELKVRPTTKKIMVIDDLANRSHDCDLLLDQTPGREFKSYEHLVPTDCQRITGPRYALLKPEFRLRRNASLKRRKQAQLKHILVFLGGVDRDNMTSKILDYLAMATLPADSKITVVLGPTAPWKKSIKALIKEMPVPTKLLVGVKNMADLMVDVDLAIGAAGSSSLERCCLGLPSLIVVLADNQISIAKELERTNAVRVLPTNPAELNTSICKFFHSTALTYELERMSAASANILNGDGTQSVLAKMTGSSSYRVRFASEIDAKRVFEWRYSSIAEEKFYRCSELPNYKSHHTWFLSALKDASRRLMIVMIGNIPIAHIRFDVVLDDPNKERISICVSPEIKKQGQSAEILYVALTQVDRFMEKEFIAEVHRDHIASKRLFLSLGFKNVGLEGKFLLFLLQPSDLKTVSQRF